MTVRDELLAAIRDWGIHAEVDENTPVLRSGLFDSWHLFNLLLWVEEKTGARLDPSKFEMARDWDTVGDILRFMGVHSELHRPRPHPGPPAVPWREGPYEIARYRPEFKQQILRLAGLLWGPDPAVNSAYFSWKYERNPYLTEPLLYVALHHDKVVGLRGVYGARWRVGRSGKTAVIPFVDDLVIDPGHRNRGLVTQIMRALLADLASRDYPCVLSFRGGTLTVLDSYAMGWKAIGELAPVERRAPGTAVFRIMREVARRVHLADRISDRSWLLAPRECRPFLHLDRSTPRRPVTAESRPRVEAMADLVNRLPWDGRICHVRDEQYFDWVFSNPRIDYRFVYWGNKSLAGYLVLSRVVSARREDFGVDIADWEATDDRVRSALLSTAVRGGRFAKLVCLTATLPASTCRLLRSAGFAPGRAAARSSVRPTALVRVTGDGQGPQPCVVVGRRVDDISEWDIRRLW